MSRWRGGAAVVGKYHREEELTLGGGAGCGLPCIYLDSLHTVTRAYIFDSDRHVSHSIL